MPSESSSSLSLSLCLFFPNCSTGHARPSFPDQGLNPCPSQWRRRVLTIGPPGKSLALLSTAFLLPLRGLWVLLVTTLPLSPISRTAYHHPVWGWVPGCAAWVCGFVKHPISALFRGSAGFRFWVHLTGRWLVNAQDPQYSLRLTVTVDAHCSSVTCSELVSTWVQSRRGLGSGWPH